MTNQKPHINDYKDGMNKDFNMESFPATGYEDAHNLRVFTSGDGASLGAVQNFEGNQLIFNLPSINGEQLYIIGTCQLRDSIVVFATPNSTQAGGHGYIYEVDFNFQSLESNYTLIYDSIDLKFSRLYPIEAIGIKENQNYERVYFSDFENFTKSINIRDPFIGNSPVNTLKFFPNPGIERPVVSDIQTGGQLRPGVYSYAYYFTTEGGNTTILSPVSQQVHIVNDSDNSALNTTVYKGVPEIIDEEYLTTKAVSVTIPLDLIPDDTYTECTLVALYQAAFEQEPVVLQVRSQDVTDNPDSITIVHTGNEAEDFYLTFGEFTTQTIPFKTNKTFGIKDNILFCANIKGDEFEIPDEIKEGLITTRYKSNQLSFIDDGFSKYVNPFNDESGTVFNTNSQGTYQSWLSDYQYKYKSNGTTLGGQAPLLSYEFTLDRLEGDTSVNDSPGNDSYLRHFYVQNNEEESFSLDDGVDYKNRSFKNLASPYNRVKRGYKRGETYRFGIVFFSETGTASSVQYIGDIKFPEISDKSDTPVGTAFNGDSIYNFPTALSRAHNGGLIDYTDLFTLGIKFTVNIPQDFININKISHYQIVRVKRTDLDKTRVAQGVINKWYIPAENDQGDSYQPKWYPIAEMTDIPGHLHSYKKNSDESTLGEPAQSFNYGGYRPVVNTGYDGGDGISTNQLEYGLGYGSVGTRGNLVETSISYQSAASVTCLLSFFCPEATYNHFVPTLKEDVDFLKTVGILTHTTKFTNDPGQFPFGSTASNEDNFDLAPGFTKWGHTFYAKGTTIEVASNVGNTGGERRYRPFLGDDNGNGAGNSSQEYPEYQNPNSTSKSSRRFTTKARQTSPINALAVIAAGEEVYPDMHLWEENFHKVQDMIYMGPDTYHTETINSVGTFQCLNLAWQLGNVHANEADKTRLARGGTNLVVKLGDLSGQGGWEQIGGPVNTPDRAGEFIAQRPEFLYAGGDLGKNYAGGAYLVDYTRRITSQYGGVGELALSGNTFIATSAPIKATDTQFEVFEGDTFVTMYEFLKNFWNNQWTDNTGDGSGATMSNDAAFNGNNSSTHETVILPIESSINCALNSGATIYTSGRFSPDGNDPQAYRLQEFRDVNNTSNILVNGTSKAFDYNPVYSNEQITKLFFTETFGSSLVDKFDVRTYYSGTKNLGEKLDSFTRFGLLNYKDIDPAYGPINRLLNLKDELITVQDDAIGVFVINTRELLTSESGSLITLGTGAGFQDFQYLTTQNGGIHQYAAIVSNQTAYILDAKRKSLVILEGTQAGDISKATGMNDYFNKNIKGMVTLTREQGGDNPLIGIGATIGYDQVNREVLISVFGNKVGYNLNTMYGVEEGLIELLGGGVDVSPETEIYVINGNILQKDPLLQADPQAEFLPTSLPTLQPLDSDYELRILRPIQQASDIVAPTGFTVVFSEVAKVFTSFYSFLPALYVNQNRAMFSIPQGNFNKLYIHNEGDYGVYYDSDPAKSSITIVVNSSPLLNKILRFIEYNCIVKNDQDEVIQSSGITEIRIENDYQDSDIQVIDQTHRFRKFRVKLPRDKDGGRFRGTYFKVSLLFDNSVNLSLTLQRIMGFFDIQTY